MEHDAQSPYARALGERILDLPPNLQAYFRGVGPGMVGIGEGVFTRIGTPRRWLWPLLRLFERRGVMLAGWYENVPFTITNRVVASRAIAERQVRRPGGDWIMRDAVARGRHDRIVNQLGEPGMVAAIFEVVVDEGHLLLRSTSVGVQLGGVRLRVPRVLAPRVLLQEGADAATGRQALTLTVDVPLIGRIYEYAGSFDYRIEKEPA